MIRCIVLDAHGVIFHPEESNADLLYCFVEAAGGIRDRVAIRDAYIQASLGLGTPEDYWKKVGLDATVEDRYLAQIGLMPGFAAFCVQAQTRGIPVWCLSNDVTRWATKLRARHEVDRHLAGCLISGDVGLRKPDPAIYRLFLERSGYAAKELVFLDDRMNNVDAANEVGFQAIQFRAAEGFSGLATRLWGVA